MVSGIMKSKHMSPTISTDPTGTKLTGQKNKGNINMNSAERRRQSKRAARKQRNKPYSVSETWSRIQAQATQDRKVSDKTATDTTLITL